jgi:stage II sporulation protein AA (anti-sigma F factor antagonist)
MFLTTRVSERPSCTVVSVEGELDMSTASDLSNVLTSAIEAREVSVVLDLASLDFCDSAGLAVFVGAHNRLDAVGRRLVVAAPSEAVARVLDLSGVSQVIPTMADPDEACAMVSNG